MAAAIVILLTPVAALVLGYAANSQIKKSHGWISGGGMAIAAIVIGWIELVLIVALIALAIAMLASLPEHH